MNENIIVKSRKHIMLNSIVMAKIPSCYNNIFQDLDFPLFYRILAKAVLKIELFSRSWYLRCPEIVVSSFNSLLSILFKSTLRNYTVGPYQIGIITSLKWTRTKLNPVNYFYRMLLLITPKGSSRIFRISVHRFLKSCKERSNDILKYFAKFYNGTNKNTLYIIPYDEVLTLLTKKQFEKYDYKTLISPKIQSSVNTPIKLNKYKFNFNLINDVINSRFENIKNIIKDSNKLSVVLILCSKSKRDVIFTNIYGAIPNPIPVIEYSRSIASTIKIPLYSAFIENYDAQLDKTFVDEPVTLKWKNNIISPRNSDNKFRSETTLEYAFANSINTIAIQIIQLLGIDNFVNYLRKCGIYCPLPNTPLLSLGNIKLTGWELLATFSPIINEGHLLWILSNNHDNELHVPVNNGEKLLSEKTTEKMKYLLRTTINYGTGKYISKKHNNALGGKTGTSEKNTDLWFVGIINSDIYGLIWMGLEDEMPIQTTDTYQPSASRFAVPLWSDLLTLPWNECI